MLGGGLRVTVCVTSFVVQASKVTVKLGRGQLGLWSGIQCKGLGMGVVGRLRRILRRQPGLRQIRML